MKTNDQFQTDATKRGRGDVEPVLVCATELARMMQVSERTLWRLRSAGQLVEPVRIGGNTRWRLDDVRKWVAEGCPASTRRDN